MKLKPLLFLLGAAGAAAAVIKRRGGSEQLTQAASAAAGAVPQPVKDAAQQAGATVQRVVENAPQPVQDAVNTVTSAGGGDEASTQSTERYEPPAEALSQPPATPGGLPSDDVPVHDAPPVSSIPGDALNEPEHDLPEGAVMPDTSDDDPLVREQTKAARGAAGAIGGNVDELAVDDEGTPDDPAMRPVVEGAGDEVEESFEAREGVERSNREAE
jgi:hypothetical protein